MERLSNSFSLPDVAKEDPPPEAPALAPRASAAAASSSSSVFGLLDSSRLRMFVLPKISNLSCQQLGFLHRNFGNLQDLLVEASNILSRLNSDSSDLDDHLIQLRRDLTKHTVSWISGSFIAKSSMQILRMKLESLCLPTFISGSCPKTVQRKLNQELPQLVVELCRIQSVRKYVEAALKLEALVGDLEDSVFHPTKNHKGRVVLKPERFNHAIKAMSTIEEVLVDVTSHHSWSHLVESVDSRVDKSLSILRPQIIAEHRALLSSLGWPPKLATAKRDDGEVSSIPNPLLLIQGDKKESYSQSFLVLCALQHSQTRRDKRRKLNMPKNKDLGLWAIDELVLPIASRMEHHFTKWVEQPEFVFALVYKVIRDFGDGVDGVLQPLIDKARLKSCSAKEAWVLAIVQTLYGFLVKKVFPGLAKRYKEKHTKSEVISSWLHLVDLMVAFDKRLHSFLGSDTCFFGKGLFEASLENISVMAIFCDKPEWLKTWEKIELKDAYRKLKEEIKDEKAWLVDNEKIKVLESNTLSANFVLSTREDYKAPFAAESALSTAWELIKRGLTLPVIQRRFHFVRATAAKFLWYFCKILLLQSKKTEFSYDNPDEDALIEVCVMINAARYIESKLQEWNDDLNIVEMTVAEANAEVYPKSELSNQSCFFEEEVESLVELETDWLMKTITVLLHQFENLCGDYFHSNELLPSENIITDSSDMAVSAVFAEALDGLRTQLHILNQNLNLKDFSDLWRSLAEGLDHYISRRIFSGETFFSRKWFDQFGSDVLALLVVFQPYCVRPEAFFPCVRETLRLLRMSEEEVKHLRRRLVKKSGGNGMSCTSEFEISHLPLQQVERFLRCYKAMS